MHDCIEIKYFQSIIIHVDVSVVDLVSLDMLSSNSHHYNHHNRNIIVRCNVHTTSGVCLIAVLLEAICLVLFMINSVPIKPQLQVQFVLSIIANSLCFYGT